MNCKQGDLAVIVRDAPLEDTAGVIVEVVEFFGYYGDVVSHFPQLAGTPRWWVRSDRPLRLVRGDLATEFICADLFLRPIRPQSDGAVDQIVERVGAAPTTLTEVLQGCVA